MVADHLLAYRYEPRSCSNVVPAETVVPHIFLQKKSSSVLVQENTRLFFVMLDEHNEPLLAVGPDVDVLTGKIHRVIDGEEVWEEEPEVKIEYKRLCVKAYMNLRRDTKLRRMIEQYGGLS